MKKYQKKYQMSIIGEPVGATRRVAPTECIPTPRIDIAVQLAYLLTNSLTSGEIPERFNASLPEIGERTSLRPGSLVSLVITHKQP